jgi:hypothetical protein
MNANHGDEQRAPEFTSGASGVGDSGGAFWPVPPDMSNIELGPMARYAGRAALNPRA